MQKIPNIRDRVGRMAEICGKKAKDFKYKIAEMYAYRRSEIASEKQVDPESNAVSRILNMEVRAQLPADTSDALLWKRIEQAKKL
ncbi:unnamed protein product [Rhizophagus irregularis]|nr:unnamed protein product [Rhizophagus irregularis]CAB5387066.1 unnamed protein product [Rhizophagus irregularis]